MIEVAPKMDVKTSRRFKRTVPLGMKVWRSLTVNFDCAYIVEHIVTACPGYILTENGPVHKHEEKEIENES